MHHKNILIAMLALSVALLAGCVTNRSQESFQQIDENVARRVGRTIDWHQVPADAENALSQADLLLEEDLGMEAAVKIALLQNPNLQILYESIGIAEAEVVKTMLPPNPVMEIGYTRIRSDGHSWEFNLVQELVGMIMIPWRKKTAEVDAERVRSQVAAGVLDLILDVKVAYRRVQAARQTLGMLEKTLKSDQAAFKMAERLRDAGNISKLEKQGRKVVMEQTKVAVSNAELNLAESRERLNVLLGLNHDRSQWKISEPLPEIRENPLAPEKIKATARQNSLDLEMAQIDLQRTVKRGRVVNFTSILPDLKLEMRSERESGGTWKWGPLLAFPLSLFDWGQAERTIADAEIRRAVDYEKMISVKLGAAARLTARRLQTRREQVIQYENTIIPLKKELTEETQRHFNAMQVGVFDLLAAKNEELSAKRNYIEALVDYWIARAETDHLMSGRMLPDLHHGIRNGPELNR